MTRVGVLANTFAPVPVSSVNAAARFALEGVAKNVATPVPSDVIPVPPFATGSVPVTPVVKGSPVAFVNVPDAGVPRAPPDVSKVADDGIVVELIVKPSTFVTVAPELIVVLPRVGAE